MTTTEFGDLSLNELVATHQSLQRCGLDDEATALAAFAREKFTAAAWERSYEEYLALVGWGRPRE